MGVVMGAFGVQGAVKVESLTDFGDRFDPGAELRLGGEARRVEWSRPGSRGVVVKLAGLDDRASAEGLRGRYLEVPEADLRRLPAGAWYHHDLVGLSVVTAGGVDLGRLSAVLTRPANDVWVAHREGVEHLLPATRDAILEVDLEGRRVVVADWLLRVEDT
ncbi:MAG: ribosome maturation factor RimM [Candidatus Dormibacteraeota bacterium]|nr:ribosome maturation factor RimM [Candidatus Dormibacteraeota bacterium]